MAKKISKKLPTRYYCEIYRCWVYFHIGWNESDMIEYSKNNYGHEPKYMGAGMTIFLEKNDCTAYAIWTKRKGDYSCIAHECLHTAMDILKVVGIDPRDSDSETVCYLLTILMDKALGINKVA